MSKNDSIDRYLELVFRYQNDIYLIIRNVVREHYLAEELTQVVMAKAWNSFHTLKKPESSKAWVKAITKNVIREYMRNKSVYLSIADRRVFNDMELKELRNIEDDILDAIVTKEDVDRVFKALELLDNRYSHIIRYNLIGGFSLKEVAAIMHMNYGTVRSYYSKGMRMLRDIYYELEKGGRLHV